MEDHVHDHELMGARRSRWGLEGLTRPRARLAGGAFIVAMLTAVSASAALSVSLDDPGPSDVGEPVTFAAKVTGATGPVTYTWTFVGQNPVSGGEDMAFTFADVGHLFSAATVEVQDASGATARDDCNHLVHYPLTPKRPTSSSPIIYDPVRRWVFSVNQDNDSIVAVDAEKLTKIGELPVYRDPEALALDPDGKLWVLHKDDYAVAVIDPDQGVIERGFRLPYASQPIGLAMSPIGDAAYVTLMATGKLLKLEPRSGQVLAELDVGPKPRGLAVSHDGKDVYVTRFISADDAGQVIKVDAPSMTVVTQIPLVLDSSTADGPTASRGLPNFLFAAALTPDGRQAWVPSKKDNILRGFLRDVSSEAGAAHVPQALNHDDTIRPLASVIDTASAQELVAQRVDLDNRSPPLHVEFSPYGDWAILTLGGSNRIEIRNVYDTAKAFSAINDVGRTVGDPIGTFPRATVLSPNKRLFVQVSLRRELWVYDLAPLLDEFSSNTPSRVMNGDQPVQISTVTLDKVPPQILRGKQLFNDSSDERMANEQYITCGACHFEGAEDGRVYDFSVRDEKPQEVDGTPVVMEGFRNTLSLLGRKGDGQGRLNWTGNMDEVQDVEHLIREMLNGKGFVWANGMPTPRDVLPGPLDAPLAGQSVELDALAAYVESLDHVNPSPYRNPDGSLTAGGAAGKAIFQRLGCDFCHGGPGLTDSARGLLHDVGTITPSSGNRMGAELTGFDTPTLLGVWETPPYLHDGSALTLRDVLTTRNSSGLHGDVGSLSPDEIDQLVAYLQQIDSELPVTHYPFDPPMPRASGGESAPTPAPGCSFARVGGRYQGTGAWSLGLASAFMAALSRRRRRPRPAPASTGRERASA